MASSRDGERATWARTAAALLVGTADPWIAADALSRHLVDATAESEANVVALGVSSELADDFRKLLPMDPIELAETCRLGAAFELGRRDQPAMGSWRLVATWTGGRNGVQHRTAETLLGLLIRARRRVRIFAPFVDGPALNALAPGIASASARGALIDLAIRQATRPVFEQVLFPIVARTGNGAMLRTHLLANDEVFPHLKVLSVDGRWAYVGSANLTWAALIHNIELGVLVDGDEVVVLDRLFDQMLLQAADDAIEG